MYILTVPPNIDPTATNFPHGLVAKADKGDELKATLLTSKKLEVSQSWRKLGSLELDTGLIIVKSLGRCPSFSPLANLEGRIRLYFTVNVLIMCFKDLQRLNRYLAFSGGDQSSWHTLLPSAQPQTKARPSFDTLTICYFKDMVNLSLDFGWIYLYTFWLSGLKSTSSISLSWALISLRGLRVGNRHKRT